MEGTGFASDVLIDFVDIREINLANSVKERS
jgi:hypothetical protein